MLAVVLAVKQAKSLNFPEGLVYDTILMIIPCAIIGARLYFVACNLEYYTKNPGEIFNLRNGGLAIYGGVIGATLGLLLFVSASYTPLPGASGAQEGGFMRYFDGIFPGGTKGLALLIWRFFTFYLYLVVGVFTILLEKLILRREAKKRAASKA